MLWDDVMGVFVCVWMLVGSGRDEDVVCVYEVYVRGVKDFVKAYRADEDLVWMSEVWYVVVDDVRVLV